MLTVHSSWIFDDVAASRHVLGCLLKTFGVACLLLLHRNLIPELEITISNLAILI